MTDIKTTGASDTKTIVGGNPNDNRQLVTCDQVTITGDGSVERPLVAIGGGGSVGPGTVNRVAKFTAATAVGDSAVSDNGTAVAIAGRVLRSQSTGVFDGAENQVVANYLSGPLYMRVAAGPAYDFNQLFFVGVSGGPHVNNECIAYNTQIGPTVDTTVSGGCNVMGVQAQCIATRVAGAGPVTNCAFQANAQFGDVNYSFFGSHGVLRNDDDITTSARYIGGVASKLQLGATPGATVDSWITTPVGVAIERLLQVSMTAAGDHTTETSAVVSTTALSYDLTAGLDKNASALEASSVGTRSAGAGRLFNLAVKANASGGQQNWSWYSQQGWMRQDGDAYFGALCDVTGTFSHHGALAGFFGAAPVPQQAHIPDAAPGTEIATINAILDLLQAYGLMAP